MWRISYISSPLWGLLVCVWCFDGRFGADAVFRSKDNVLTDQDLDAVLERGAKKTKMMQEKLDVADKGDMLDFKIDDNSGVQVRSDTPLQLM